MRYRWGAVGAILGAAVGVVAGFTFADLTTGGNSLAAGFVLLIAGPLGLLAGAWVGATLALRALHFLRTGRGAGWSFFRKTLLVADLLIAAPFLIAAMLQVVRIHDSPPPDQQLLANFRRHQETFDRVIRMLQTDKGLIRVDEDWTDPDDPGTIGVSPTRLAEYRRLLRGADVPHGFGVEKKSDEVEFYYWLRGSAISSHTNKGYVYLTKRPAHLLSSLDSCHENRRGITRAYRHLGGNWYLFYEFLPG